MLHYFCYMVYINSLAAIDVYRSQSNYNRSLPMTSIDVNRLFNELGLGRVIAYKSGEGEVKVVGNK